MRKKIKLKKIGEFSGFHVWYVNGYWIRKNIDPEFTNSGSRINFPFIPKDELWIDTESRKKEAGYLIENFLALQRELKKGKSYAEAIRIADEIEKKERAKSKFIKKLKRIKIREKILKKVRKKILFQTKKFKIWLVRGDLVRGLFFIDFTQGGHDKVYRFIPKNEIWIDDSLSYKEIPYVLVHELYERELMEKGWPYAPKELGIPKKRIALRKKYAHFAAGELEDWCRHHPKTVKKMIIEKIKKNEELIKD